MMQWPNKNKTWQQVFERIVEALEKASLGPKQVQNKKWSFGWQYRAILVKLKFATSIAVKCWKIKSFSFKRKCSVRMISPTTKSKWNDIINLNPTHSQRHLPQHWPLQLHLVFLVAAPLHENVPNLCDCATYHNWSCETYRNDKEWKNERDYNILQKWRCPMIRKKLLTSDKSSKTPACA